ncbi:MAG: OsmC family peroxiredoxin [Anaerolineae bacterium]
MKILSPLRHAFEQGKSTNPQERIGAAHTGCFSMSLSVLLSETGTPPTYVHTTASVHLEAGPMLRKIELYCEAEVPGLDDARFQELVARARRKNPVSRALAAVGEVTPDCTAGALIIGHLQRTP